MADSYPFGYPNGDPSNGAGVSLSDYKPGNYRTLVQLNGIWTWRALNPEIRRRAIALFDYCAANGHPEGIGTGARSEAAQAQLYIDRGGKGVAPAGQSYHEDKVPIVGACAIDCVPSNSHKFMNSVAHLFGFKHFRNVGSEPWHIQPIEFPTARRDYNRNPKAYPLRVWEFPSSIPQPPPPPPAVPTSLEYWRAEGAKMTTPPGDPMLKIGSPAVDNVRWLQAVLVAEDFYTGAVDGLFGQLTDAAVKRMQSAVGVGADGQYGPKSSTAFSEYRAKKTPTPPPPTPPPPSSLPTPPGSPSMKLGSTNATTIIPGVANDGRVSWLQAVLLIPQTGVYDTATVNSVKSFQTNMGLTVDGIYGTQTETALRAYRGL